MMADKSDKPKGGKMACNTSNTSQAKLLRMGEPVKTGNTNRQDRKVK
jgi:hypothetical protein